MVGRLCQSAFPSDYAEAFRYAEMAKSRALIEMLTGRPLRRPENVPSGWLEKETQLRQSLRQLYEDPAAERNQIASLEAELDQLRQRIRLRDAEFESFHTVAPLSLDEVMPRLPADGVLLEYFTAGDTILAFVITPTEISVVHLPLHLKELQRAFARMGDGKLYQLRHLTRDKDHRLRQPWILNKLYQTLLEPLGEIIWSSPLLCVVPHGLLHYVPFHALYQQTESGQRYLVGDSAEPRNIVYAPSATTLFEYCQRKPPSSQRGCLTVGYNGQTLTQAELEADRIARVIGGESRTGAAATRTSFFEEGASYRYLHLSCHGWFNPSWPMASSLNLADGHLDVTDVLQNLRLNADLVSLSACETGRSHVLRGDELIGLVRAFLYAGTLSVVVSHWVVDELSTRLLMERFYQELVTDSNQTGMGSKAEVMSRAQNFIKELTYEELSQMLLAGESTSKEINQQLQYLAISAGYDSTETLHGDECLLAHPYYWAPFFLVGDQLVELDPRI
jgi:CHAT domain-containing protein